MTTYTPFLLLTPRLLIVPTPFLLTVEPYLTFYASLHARHDFCNMAFGDHLPARQWSQEEQVDKVRGEVERNWTKGRGMGDMGVGLWSGRREGLGRVLQGCGEGEEEVRIVEGEEAERLVAEGKLWDEVEWSGYAGVREARLPPREEGDEPLPSWLELVEVRYGLSPAHWGKRIIPEAARAVLQWASTQGVKRFIAETERNNERSAGVLQRMGFERVDANWWKNPPGTSWCWAKPVLPAEL